jgi:hypothetical protein
VVLTRMETGRLIFIGENQTATSTGLRTTAPIISSAPALRDKAISAVANESTSAATSS